MPPPKRRSTGKRPYKKPSGSGPPPEITRVRMPKGREVIGVVEQRVGGGRTVIACLDGQSRICRVPGRLKRRLWIREGDTVIVEPWEFSSEKADILFKYTRNQVKFLEKKGLLAQSEDFEEF